MHQTYERDVAHEADMRELRYAQLVADFGDLSEAELLAEISYEDWDEPVQDDPPEWQEEDWDWDES